MTLRGVCNGRYSRNVSFTLNYLRNKSWKPECVGSFNMGWRIWVCYPEPELKLKTHSGFHDLFWFWYVLRVQIRWYTLIGRRLFIFTFAEYVAHNLCCQIQADDNSSTCTFTTGKSVTCTGACANEIIPNR